MGPQLEASRPSSDLRGQLTSKRVEDGRDLLKNLQKENELRRREQELSKQWLKLRTEFCKAGKEFPPPTLLDDPTEQRQ